jgi:hypothetical protein
MARIEHPGYTSLLGSHRAGRPRRMRRLGPPRGGDGWGDLRPGAAGASAPDAGPGGDRRTLPRGNGTAPFVRQQRHRAGHRGCGPAALEGRPGPRRSGHRGSADLHPGSAQAPGATGAGAPGARCGHYEGGQAPHQARSASARGGPAADSPAAARPRLRRHRPGTSAVRHEPEGGRGPEGRAPAAPAAPAVRGAHGPRTSKSRPRTPPRRGYPPRNAPPAALPQPPLPLIPPGPQRPRTREIRINE